MNRMDKLPFLDGLRGVLALWVFWGHLSFFCGLQIPGVSAPGWAVDGFMLLSGFLMVHTTRSSMGSGPQWPAVKRFYVARFFRVAPLYYVMLLIGVLFAQSLSSMELSWLTAVHGAGAAEHVPDKSGIQSPLGLLAHMSFLFGLVPSLAVSSPMPDWSLSLEMQFYLLFPAFWFVLRRVRSWVLLVALAIALAFAAAYFLGYYAKPGQWVHFKQPSLLLHKLPIFFAGMMLAQWHGKDSPRPAWLDMALMAACLARSSPLVWLFLVVLVYLLVRPGSALARRMSSRPMEMLGAASYAVYLCHFILMAPVLYMLSQVLPVSDISAWQRFGITIVVATLVVLPVSYLLHVLIEKPMIEFGKKVRQ